MAAVEENRPLEDETTKEPEKRAKGGMFSNLFHKKAVHCDYDMIDIEQLKDDKRACEEEPKTVRYLNGQTRPYAHPDSEATRRISDTQHRVNESIIEMSELVNKCIQRDESLQGLEKDITDLAQTTKDFMENAETAQKSLWWKNKKMGLLLGGGFSFTLLAVGGFCLWFFVLR